ncbi:DNA-repair protein, UmuC-like domain protein, partial [mine drainage metagenome]
AEILERSLLPCSVGIAPNLTLAKMASDRAKPGGVVVVLLEEVPEFLAPLPVRSVPGVGPVTERALLARQVRTIRELTLLSPRELKTLLGSSNPDIVRMARGESTESPWPEEEGPHSVGSMSTFDVDTEDADALSRELRSLATRVAEEVKRRGLRFRTVTLRVRYEDFSQVQRSQTLPRPTDAFDALRRVGEGLLGELLRERRGSPAPLGPAPVLRVPRRIRTLSLTVQGLREVPAGERPLEGFLPGPPLARGTPPTTRREHKDPPGLPQDGGPLNPDPLPLLPECETLVSELSRPRVQGRFPAPAYGGASLPNLAVSAYLHAGGKPFPGMLPPLDARHGPRPDPEGTTQVVFLVDSFGWKMFLDLLREPPGETGRKVASGLARFTRPITSVFPPTTSSALLSLSTGTAPGTHGIVGYTEYFPGWGAILNTLKLSPPWAKVPDLAAGKRFTAADWVPVPSLFTRRTGSVALTKAEFQGSAFTRVLYDGAEFVGYLGLSDLVHQLLRVLGAPAERRPPLVWVYWDLLDSVNHVYGPEPRFAQEELTHLLLALASVARQLPSATGRKIHLWITGDHGQVPVRPEGSHAVHETPPSSDCWTARRPASAGRPSS